METVPYERTALENMIDWMNEIRKIRYYNWLHDLGVEIVKATPAIDSLPDFVKDALVGFLDNLCDAEEGLDVLISALSLMRDAELDKAGYTISVYSGHPGCLDLARVEVFDDAETYGDACADYFANDYHGKQDGKHTMVWPKDVYYGEDE
jgi:hypothetical protein